MEQFDIFENLILKGRKMSPFVRYLQNKLLYELSIRVVVLVSNNSSFAFDEVSVNSFCPVFDIDIELAID